MTIRKALARRRAVLAPLLVPSAPAAMEMLIQLELEIKDLRFIPRLVEIADTAAGLQRIFWPVRSPEVPIIKEIADRAGELWCDAESKLGRAIKDLERKNGRKIFDNQIGSE